MVIHKEHWQKMLMPNIPVAISEYYFMQVEQNMKVPPKSRRWKGLCHIINHLKGSHRDPVFLII